MVISTLKRWSKSKLILGNHDDWFLRVLGSDTPDPAVVRAWFNNGGLPTILNYDYEADLHYARQAITREYEHHVALFRQASIIELDGAFAFVHAGVNPDRAIDDQTQKDCLRIRKPFLEHVAPLSHVIVHGHTVTESRRPVIASNRIAIDTEAYTTGHLTAVIMDPHAKSLEFASTMQEETEIGVEFVKPDQFGILPVLAEYFSTGG